MNLQQLQAELYKKSLYDFVKDFWSECDPAPFKEGTVIEYLCECFMWAVRGWLPSSVTQHFISDAKLKSRLKKYLNLVNIRDKNAQNYDIELPPRHIKTKVFNVFGPCWLFAQVPIKVASVCHSEQLSTSVNIQRQKIVSSARWKQYFPEVWLTKNEGATLIGNHLGELYSINRKSFTGYGADLIINDDVVSAEQARKDKAEMASALHYYRDTMPSRRNDPLRDVIFNIQQRLASGDISGTIRADKALANTYNIICLKALATGPEIIVFPCSGKIWKRNTGDPLWPQRFGDYSDLRIQLGEAVFETQCQQNPMASEDTYVKPNMINYLKPSEAAHIMDNPDFIYASHDFPVKDKEESDNLGSLVAFQKGNTLLITEALERKADITFDINYVTGLATTTPGLLQIIEDKANGSPVLDLLQGTLTGLIAFNPGMDSKAQRLEAGTPYLVAKNVYFLCNELGEPNEAIKHLVTRLLSYPFVDHDDLVDAFSMLILYVFGRLKFSIFNSSITKDNRIPANWDPKGKTGYVGLNRMGNMYQALRVYYEGNKDTFIVTDDLVFRGDEHAAVDQLRQFAGNLPIVDGTGDNTLFNVFLSHLNILSLVDKRPLSNQVGQLKLGLSLRRILFKETCYNLKQDLWSAEFDRSAARKGEERLKRGEGTVACLRAVVYFVKGKSDFFST